jgi:hypothetical protein
MCVRGPARAPSGRAARRAEADGARARRHADGGDDDAAGARTEAVALLPALQGHLEEYTARELSAAAAALARMRCLTQDLVRQTDECFARALARRDPSADLIAIANLLDACSAARAAVSPALLARMQAWLAAAAPGGGAAGSAGGALARARPGVAALLMRAWVAVARNSWLPAPVVRALAGRAAAGVGAGARDGIAARHLSPTLHALAVLVARSGAARPDGGRGSPLDGLQGALAGWAGAAISHVAPGAAQAARDVRRPVCALHALGVTPPADVAASAVFKVAAVACLAPAAELLQLAAGVAGPLAEWDRRGLVSSAPAADALYAQAARINCRVKADFYLSRLAALRAVSIAGSMLGRDERGRPR